jgi:D-alanyl-lipoteichoic acid acyltransferase DltB (MBOAT superfamily)
VLFQSQFFVLLFLPITVISYYAVANSERARQTVLIAASLIFYGWWDARFIPLLVVQVTATWLLALMHAKRANPAWLDAGVVLNLLSLATFKYLNFLLVTVEDVSGLTLPRAEIILPIGISFFSFQLISYLVDRRRGQAPIYPFRQFALFVMVFPHLIAGPIVRHNELIPQFSLEPLRAGLWRRIGCGVTIFSVGFAKKVLLADHLAEMVNRFFSAAGSRVLNFGESWSAALGFSFQLFLDFSAYTEMAIGIALLFGLTLPENFNRPYLATDLRDFWRRWHISLSNFLRDYLFIPLGGSRAGFPRYILATLVTMGLCGLWHGAGWTFVAWGLFHGSGLVICRIWQQNVVRLPTIVGWTMTMAFVVTSWVIFRASDFSVAGSMLQSMSGLHGFSGNLDDAGLLIACALVSVLVPSAHSLKDRLLKPNLALAASAAILAIVCIFDVGGGSPINFIYFQF